MTPTPVRHDPGNLTAPQAVAADELEHAIGRYVAAGRPYAAIPFLLTSRMGGAYPLGPLMDDPRLCCSAVLSGAGDRTDGGFERDDVTGVDWFCLLAPDHGDRCGYVDDYAVVGDAMAAGYFAELTPVDDDLEAELDASILARLVE